MTLPSPSAILLQRLLSLTPTERMACVAEAGDPQRVLVDLGDEAERLVLVEASKAIAASEAVMALADALNSALAMARARRAHAQALTYSGKASAALAIAQEAVQIAERAEETIESGRDRMAVLHALVELGRYDDALRVGEEARQLFVQAGAPAFAARADINLGVVLQNRDDPSSALMHFERARAGLVNEPAMLGPLESNRGEALLNLNDLAGAEAAFLSARGVFESTGAELAAAIVEGNLADLSVRQGLLHRAMFYFERARRRLESDASVGHLARVLAEQADALGVLGLPDQAKRSYEEALPMLSQCGLVAEQARARAGLARSLLALGQLEDAVRELECASELFESIHHTSSSAHVKLIRAQVLDALGRASEARVLANDALIALEDRPVDAAVARYTLALLALRQQQPSQAIDILSPALAAAERLDIPPLRADLLHLEGLAHRGLGRLDASSRCLQSAVAQIERVRGSLQAERFRAAFLGNRIQVYEDLVRVLLDQASADAVRHAFAATEQAKSRSLLDLVRGAVDLTLAAAEGAESSNDAALIGELLRLRGELNALYSRLHRGGGENQRRASEPGWHDALLMRERKLQNVEDRLASSRGVATLFASPVELDEVLAHLPSGMALIEYFFVGDELLAFLLGDGKARVFRGLANRNTIENAVRRLRFQMVRASAPGSHMQRRSVRFIDDARAELRHLHDLLVTPLSSAIVESETLAFVGHGPLHFVPFHALWDGHRHLVQDRMVSVCPSSSLLVQLMRRAPTGQGVGDRVVVGVADQAAPHIREEAHAVARQLGAARVLLDGEATLERVKQALIDARILHIACHGMFAADQPMASGLQLADGWLTVRDVYALRMNAELVTLSGCDTGRNRVTSGDELLGLVRGFLAAGAQSLLVSLWSVGDQSTAELMGHFYRHWPGENAKEHARLHALRAAQLAMMDARPHPVHWAAFQLVGRP